MSCRGIFFALTDEQEENLLALSTDRERLEYIHNHIEAEWDEEHLLPTDKAWDAIHRCLTDGTLKVTPTANPLSRLILGGEQLYSDWERYVINLVEWRELPEILKALTAVTKASLKARYEQLRFTDYPKQCISTQDWEYTWAYFSEMLPFLVRAYEEKRSILFTVDQ